MAELPDNSSGSKRSLTHKPHQKKGNIRVDMTPMVDLGFLLICFFMLTMVLSEEHMMELDKRISDVQDPVGDCQVLNVLIDEPGQMYVYEGLQVSKLTPATFDAENGIRQLLIDKGRRVKQSCGKDSRGNDKPMICLIKLLPGAKYKDMVDILDEMQITDTKMYSFQEPLPDEVNAVKEQELLAVVNKN